MGARKLLSKQQEQKVEGLLWQLESRDFDLNRTHDKLREYFANNDLLCRGMPSQADHPPVLFYLASSSWGRQFLANNIDLLNNITTDALNFIHQQGESTLSRFVLSTFNEVLSFPFIAEKVDPDLFNRKFQNTSESMASYLFRTYPQTLFKCEEVFAQKVDDASFAQGFAALLEHKDGFALLMQSSAFQARVTAELLNAHAETILDSSQGRAWLAKNPQLCAQLTADSVRGSLGVLVHDGTGLLIAVPSLADKIDSKQLNVVRLYSYGRLAHQLLTTEQGQRVLNANPALVAKIDPASVNQRIGSIGHTKFFHQVLSPQQREKVRVDNIWGHIIYDVLSTEHGKQFLIQNDAIRKMITEDSLNCKFNKGRFKGQSINTLLKKPEFAELKVCFERDKQERLERQRDILETEGYEQLARDEEGSRKGLFGVFAKLSHATKSQRQLNTEVGRTSYHTL